MTARAHNRRRRDSSAGNDGFTLIEMIVALAILGVAMALAGASIARRPQPSPMRMAEAMQSMLLRARSDAMLHRRDTVFVIDTKARQFAYPEGATPVQLPEGLQIRMVAGGEFTSKGGQTNLIYRADGSSSGAEIVLSDGHTSDALVEVNWLTGVPLLTTGG